MFSRDKNKFKVNIKASKESNVIDFTAAQKSKEKKLPKLRRKDEKLSLMQRLASVDLRTPWVIRLLAVVFVLILSMLIL
ncbi:MAG: hypothetical protein H6617_06435 [Bdellovibrionaceae bacterium]|nr:hypothetical protein [Pseudobdellovibrionaceae bacterium]